MKDLDVFHPSYRVKRISKIPISEFLSDDLFLDIIQNEKNGLISMKIDIDKELQENFYLFLESFYVTPNV